MNARYTTKHLIKLVRWQTRRAQAALRWGPGELRRSPIVLGNAMPKSGSHLIIQVLRGLTQMGPFVNPGFPPVNRSEDNQKLPDDEILAKVKRMRPGDICYGYIGSQEPFVSTLTQPGRATIFIYRDPRDMIISQIYYATLMHEGHWMHRYYTEQLSSMGERINAAIHGVTEPGSELTPVRKRYERYLGWLEQPEVLCLRFEDLILDRESTLGKLLDYLDVRGFSPELSRSEAISILKASIIPKKSGTFRKGEPGTWREYYSLGNKAIFKKETGDLLIQLGYEKDNNW